MDLPYLLGSVSASWLCLVFYSRVVLPPRHNATLAHFLFVTLESLFKTLHLSLALDLLRILAPFLRIRKELRGIILAP